MTHIFQKSNEALHDLINVLQQLPGQKLYAAPCEALSNATIGQHTRHIIELYQCLIAGYGAGEINYDDRKRNTLYENDTAAAIVVIKEIQNELTQPDKSISQEAQAAYQRKNNHNGMRSADTPARDTKPAGQPFCSGIGI